MSRFESISAPPAHLRGAYLDSLMEPQGLYIESLVEAGNAWGMGDVAYAVECENKLVELYVAPQASNRLVEIFDASMAASSASRVLCKSFDTQLVYCALSRPATVTPVGLLFRHLVDPAFTPCEGVSFRHGTDADVERVYAFNDDFFESLDEIGSYAESEGLFLLEKDGEVVGCGIGKPVIKDRRDIDIGMLVATEHRKRGYGAHIIAFLKDHYLAKGLRPICGCSIDNTGSQRALRNAGFVSEHRLLEVSY
jgi:RimJ/RimL family protein N-acetyltransferase